jgi:hypothetical protein
MNEKGGGAYKIQQQHSIYIYIEKIKERHQRQQQQQQNTLLQYTLLSIQYQQPTGQSRQDFITNMGEPIVETKTEKAPNGDDIITTKTITKDADGNPKTTVKTVTRPPNAQPNCGTPQGDGPSNPTQGVVDGGTRSGDSPYKGGCCLPCCAPAQSCKKTGRYLIILSIYYS